jgi:hypothetical protein
LILAAPAFTGKNDLFLFIFSFELYTGVFYARGRSVRFIFYGCGYAAR